MIHQQFYETVQRQEEWLEEQQRKLDLVYEKYLRELDETIKMKLQKEQHHDVQK